MNNQLQDIETKLIHQKHDLNVSGHNTREEKSVTRRYETGMRSFFLSILGLLLSKGKLAFIF